jgi:hypothetical protein
MKSKFWWLLGGVVLGVVFAPQVQKIPLVNKLPTL